MIFLFLVYILWSLFEIERDIWQVLYLDFLSKVKIFKIVVFYLVFILTISFVFSLSLFYFIYLKIQKVALSFLSQFGINFSLVFLNFKEIIAIFIGICLFLILISGVLVRFKKFQI
jgi:hypothetical protein